MAKKPTVNTKPAAIMLAMLDSSVDHTFHTAPDEESALQQLCRMCPGVPANAVRRTYMEGRNALLSQAANTARALLRAHGVVIEGILLPNAVGAIELLNQAADAMRPKEDPKVPVEPTETSAE
ncbi:amino acid adenylation domain-containing protein [Aeromonas phage PVN02]|nr:amino acid adenylation domain-containing protein [Aeromonas phage PVN02]QTQ06881.1 amino acid adenylation domain-containing protein [Aeromonas phage PVN04]CAC9972297.1 hypothetical protein PVN02_00030 [Aeromonas phage PVN02]